MKTRQILFKDDMVRAIMDGRKTQTRRLFKMGKRFADEGDTLWVKEAWRLPTSYFDTDGVLQADPWQRTGFAYRADASESELKSFRWNPSIFMPRAACRLQLRVEAVRTELLRAISDGDARREGFETVDEFRAKWTSIHGDKGDVSWTENPLVWVITFSVL